MIRPPPRSSTTALAFGLSRWSRLTTDANAEVRPIHPKAMPVILTTEDEVDTWLSAEPAEALAVQQPLPDGSLMIVAKGEREDDV